MTRNRSRATIVSSFTANDGSRRKFRISSLCQNRSCPARHSATDTYSSPSSHACPTERRPGERDGRLWSRLPRPPCWPNRQQLAAHQSAEATHFLSRTPRLWKSSTSYSRRESRRLAGRAKGRGRRIQSGANRRTRSFLDSVGSTSGKRTPPEKGTLSANDCSGEKRRRFIQLGKE